MHTSYIQRISTYWKEFLTIDMSLSFGGMLKFSSTKVSSSFYNVTFEENTITEKNMLKYNFWESWSKHRKLFPKSFQNANSFW